MNDKKENDLYSLLLKKKYSELCVTEKRFVSGLISEQEYESFHAFLESTENVLEPELKSMKPNPLIKQKLDQQFQENYRKKIFNKSLADSFFFQRPTLYFSVIGSLTIFLVLIWFGLFKDHQNVSKRPDEISEFQINDFKEMDQYLMNIDICLETEIIVPDIYGVGFTNHQETAK